MMRRFIPLLASLTVPSCDPDVSGTYALMSVDGQELPSRFELFGTVIVTSGAPTLRDSIVEFAITA
jgi:hypothetical protein